MSYVLFGNLSHTQKRTATFVHGKRLGDRIAEFEFWVRANGQVSRRAGHHRLSEAAYRAFMAKYAHKAATDPSDLNHWKPGVTFGLDKP